MKPTFKQYLAEEKTKSIELPVMLSLFEHEIYRPVPGTKNSYREDSANTNTLSLKHAHVFAKLKGKGSQLYAVNFDGTGHDGSRGTELPSKHATHFRGLGYDIPPDNILEGIAYDELDESRFDLFFLGDVESDSSEIP